MAEILVSGLRVIDAMVSSGVPALNDINPAPSAPREHRGLIPIERPQTLGEELANALSHGVALVAALVGAPVLIATAVAKNNTAMVIGGSILAGAMILMYLSSTVYHALPPGRAKNWFRVCDHAAIFLLIAGTYTPITLGVLKGAWGWSLLGAVWVLAVVGIVLKLVGGIKRPWLSTGLYLLMGWLVLFAIRPLWLVMPLTGLLWLAAGGLAYTIGTAFYAADERVKYAHFVWHLWVMAGTGCHFFAVLTSV
jgi:hemolysin III